jgi:hypothetical protein
MIFEKKNQTKTCLTLRKFSSPVFTYFQNPRVKGKYTERDYAFLCEKPVLKKEGVLADETDDEDMRHERFFVGRIGSKPKMTPKWQVALQLDRICPVFINGAWEWELASPPITDEVKSKFVVGMITADGTNYVSRTKSRFTFNWLNPSSIACFPLKKKK